MSDAVKVMVAIEGAPNLAAAVMAVKDMVQRRVLRPALSAAMRVVRDGIRDAVPQKYAKNIRKLVGMKVKSNDSTNNKLVGIAGPSAGIKRGGKAKERAAAAAAKRKKGTGVGIGAANVHWFVLGTDERYTGYRRWRTKLGWSESRTGTQTIAYRGRLDPDKLGIGGVVERGVQASEREAMQVFSVKLLEGMQREADKEWRRISTAGTRQAVKAAK